MSGLGGLNPLPLRLGGSDSTTSWTAADHAAACRDIVSASRTIPFARVSIGTPSGVATVLAYRGINGSGADAAPTAVLTGGVVRVTFPEEWEDELGDRRAIRLTKAATWDHATAAVQSTATITNAGGVEVVDVTQAFTDVPFTLVVWGSYLDDAQVTDYGGSSDKTDCETEIIPYALSSLRALQDARGSAYSRERGTIVHVENMALARAHAATWRRHERLSANGNPATAHEKAEEWRRVLGVRRRDGDTDATLRTRNAAKAAAALGPTRRTVDDSVAALLGPLYVRTWRNYAAETTTDDHAGTFWPLVNPGLATHDLGGGAWYSDRNHIVIEVEHPASVSAAAFERTMTDLTELLDLMLPATCTFDWCTGAEDGFVLDEDLLDEGCLG